MLNMLKWRFDRPIDFRVWDPDRKKMFYDILRIYFDDKHENVKRYKSVLVNEHKTREHLNVDNAILMQNTFIVDKNETDIFEGDLLEMFHFLSKKEKKYPAEFSAYKDEFEKNKPKIGIVVYKHGIYGDGCFGVQTIEDGVFTPFFELRSKYPIKNIKVIGNIYENKILSSLYDKNSSTYISGKIKYRLPIEDNISQIIYDGMGDSYDGNPTFYDGMDDSYDGNTKYDSN